MNLSKNMEATLRDAEFGPRGKLCVSWSRYVNPKTLSALRVRGLIDENWDLTEAGETWFNDNITNKGAEMDTTAEGYEVLAKHRADAEQTECCNGVGWTGDPKAPCADHYEPLGWPWVS